MTGLSRQISGNAPILHLWNGSDTSIAAPMGKTSKAKKPTNQIRRGSPSLEAGASRNLQRDLLWLLPALLLGFLIYLNSLQGEFVYDDQLQISRNTFIQDSSQVWHALTSDVWSFQGGDQTTSNYWRPSFVLWLILNFRCFGFTLLGWHLGNVLLHLVVNTLGFVLLRRLAVSAPVAGGVALIFAVHPVHCESVAWLSGAPDLILASALLGSLYFVHLLNEKQTFLRWMFAIALYLVALGAKEVALLFPLIVAVLRYQEERASGKSAKLWRNIGAITWPFVAAALIYFFIRQSILGATQRLPQGGASLTEAFLTAPSVFAFYLRQMLFPIWIGPSYPLRAVTLNNLSIPNFIIPVVVTTLTCGWLILMARWSRIAAIGFALFLVPLIPVMNIAAFGPEQLVHDRYLYLPLLGFLILLAAAVIQGVERFGIGIRRPWLFLFVLAMILSVPLAAQTVRYNHAWTSNLALWEWGVESDPTSAYAHQQHAVYLQEAKRLDEAVAALNHSIEIKPIASTYVVRAAIWIEQQKFAEAERDLRAVVSQKNVSGYTLYRAYRDLAVCLSNQGKTNEASEAIKEARMRLPQYTAALTGKLGSILWKAGQKNEAVTELNAVRERARTESLPESRLLLYGLGLLEVDLGHKDEAREAFQEFLTVSNGMLTPGIKQARSEAEANLRNLAR